MAHDIVMAAAGSAGGPAEYVEDVFSTWLYTGTGFNAQTITNGINLAEKGGLVWFKDRDVAFNHILLDTNRVSGANEFVLSSNNTNQQGSLADYVTYNNNGFTITSGATGNLGGINDPNDRHVSWTFREAPKFFDIVTWSGNGVEERQISHSLGSTPGMIIVKATNIAFDWAVWHRDAATNGNAYAYLNTTGEFINNASGFFGNGSTNTYIAPTSDNFTLSANSFVNGVGYNYVAYVFAHNAGGFGDAGTDNIISCGSYIGNGSSTGPAITLGYEPQFLLIKNATTGGSGRDWVMYDTMRGMSYESSITAGLLANRSNEESAFNPSVRPTPTGFTVNSTSSLVNTNGNRYIYMAIRRPMKKPTSGTQVFTPIARTGTGSAANITSAGFPPDLLIGRSRLASTSAPIFVDRLRGNTKFLQSVYTDVEGTSSSGSDVTGFLMNGFSLGTSGGTDLNSSGTSEIYYPLRRAPGFFDVVCYRGNGSSQSINHNLGVIPDLMIIKSRSNATNWFVQTPTLISQAKYLWLNSSNAADDNSSQGYGSLSQPTATDFSVTDNSIMNASGWDYVTYLFASLPGISQVGSYTGNGSSQTINCGFSAGARFVLIKRTNAAGDWCVFDTARGIVSGNDPFLQLNLTAAQVTGEDAVDPVSSGFIVNQTTENLNVNGATYIYLAIA